MSYYGYDDKGYVGDVASINGWNQFAAWLRTLGGAAEQLAENGAAPAADLLKAIQDQKAAGSVESTRANLAQMLAGAQGEFYVTEGT